MPARRRNPPSRAAHPSSVGPLLAARPPAQPWDGTHGCDGPRRFARVMKRIGSADRSGPVIRDALRRCASPDAPSRALPARRGDDRPPPHPRRLRCSAAPARPGAPMLTSLREPKVCAGGGPRRCGALSTRRSTPGVFAAGGQPAGSWGAAPSRPVDRPRSPAASAAPRGYTISAGGHPRGDPPPPPIALAPGAAHHPRAGCRVTRRGVGAGLGDTATASPADRGQPSRAVGPRRVHSGRFPTGGSSRAVGEGRFVKAGSSRDERGPRPRGAAPARRGGRIYGPAADPPPRRRR